MTKAERTREFIIQKSAPLFNTKGYEGTSLSDIQEATNLTKGAIYGNFADKNELEVAVFEFSCSAVLERIKEIMQKNATAKEALLAYANYYTENWQVVFKRGGCPVMNTAIEADDHLHYMKDSVRKNMKRFIKLLTTTIEQGQANNEFKANADAEEYAAFIYSVIEGNILLAKTMNTPKYFHIATKHIKQTIEQELMK